MKVCLYPFEFLFLPSANILTYLSDNTILSCTGMLCHTPSPQNPPPHPPYIPFLPQPVHRPSLAGMNIPHCGAAEAGLGLSRSMCILASAQLASEDAQMWFIARFQLSQAGTRHLRLLNSISGLHLGILILSCHGGRTPKVPEQLPQVTAGFLGGRGR